MYLSHEQFTSAVETLPLVSIDLCFFCDGSILLGKRVNKPAQEFWFTPGGLIRKNEPFEKAIQRIAIDEVGLSSLDEFSPVLMGAWDHFYPVSAFSDSVSTHYVNLPHCVDISAELKSVIDSSLVSGADKQHSAWRWMDLEEAVNHREVHPYVQAYASHLLWLGSH
jgi:colanic acid biosynthesis protein WcaH